jgi:cytochrome c oxidase subunit III
MEIGTAETNVKEKKRKLKSKMSGGLGSGGGQKNHGGGGGNGGDDDLPENEFSEQSAATSTNKFRIAMWFFLLVVLMTFGVLIGAYIFSSSSATAEWRPIDLPRQIWFSTFLILASSATYSIAQRALNLGRQRIAKNWLLATTALGAAFISSQILAWFALVKRGVYVESNPYAGFFYIMTAVHAVHVIGGIAILGYIVLRTWHKTDSEDELAKRQNISKTVGWYWHFMDALWLVLFCLLGFYK